VPTKTKAKAPKEPVAEPAGVQSALVPPAGPHIIADRDELIRVARLAAQRALTGGKSSLPALTGVKLDVEDRGDTTTLVLATSDLETFFVTETDNVVGKDARWLVPAHLFADLLEDLAPGRVTITADDARIFAEGQPIGKGRRLTKFSLVRLPYEDFPALPEIEGNECELDAPELSEALRQIVPALSKDEGRPVFTGALFTSKNGELRIDATDSYRLAIRSGVAIKCDGEDISAIVPGAVLAKLPEPEGTCRIVLGERQALFVIGRTRIMTRLIEGKYPPVESLIPTTFPYRLTTS
jgi:DNA polymerase-3 subunit beta